ncbi:MAG: ABC transporter permease, partial [Bdellovibrionales bacterium]|nr:ABC transporter permease [Bdellovibrionales bacterium]
SIEETMLENLKELYRFRSLVKALVVRHLAMRYRGSVLGFLWSFLNPLCLMLVYSLVFSYYIRFNSVDHYTIFLFCGLLPWIWVSSGLAEGATAIVSSGHLITKSMFPAHILPAVSVLTTMINFLLSLPLLFLFMWVAGMQFHITLLLLPVLIALQLLFLHGLALALSSLNVHFRDVQHIVGNVLTFLFFLCPILYPVSTVPERFRFTLDYNPLALFTLGYHQLILDGVVPSLSAFVVMGVSVLVVSWFGHAVFARYHESFAELL